MDKWISRRAGWCLVAWALWLTFEYWAFGKNSYVRLHNVGDSGLPQLLALRGNISNHIFGNWQPQWSCGADRASFPMSYNIAALFFLILPGWFAYPALMFVQRFIAGFFSFKVLRDQCEVESAAALPAAMWYALFSQPLWNRGWAGFTTYDGLGLPGIPLFLYLLGKLDQGGKRDYVTAVFAGAFLAISANFAFTFGMIPLAAYWFYSIDPRRSRRFWLLACLCFTSWVLITVPVTWPSLLLLPDSVRAKYQLQGIFGGTVSHLLGVLKIFVYNSIPALFILVGLVTSKFKRTRLFGISIALAGFAAVLMIYTASAGALGSVAPKLAAFSVDRLGFVFPWLFCAGMALSIEVLNRELVGNVKRREGGREFSFPLGRILALTLLVVIGFQSLSIKTRTLREMIDGQNQRNYYNNPALLEISRSKRESIPARVATIAVGENVLPVFPPGAVWAYGLESADSFLVLQSDRYRLFWAEVIAPLASRDEGISNWVRLFGQQLNLFPPGPRVGSVNLDSDYNVNLLSLASVRYFFSPIPIDNPHLHQIENRYLPAQLRTATLNRPNRLLQMLKGNYRGMPIYIYENQDAFPRMFWVSKVKGASDPKEVLNNIGKAEVADLRSTAFLLQRDVELGQPLDTGRTLKVGLYSADEIKISVSKGTMGYLVVNNSYSKFWRAECDGQPLQVLPTDFTFQGLWIPGTCQNLRLTYDRPGL